MKYVILIHSNPQPWGHPTGDFVAEALARPQEERDAGDAAFDAMLEELSTSGELKGGEALGDPARPGCTAGTARGTRRDRRPVRRDQGAPGRLLPARRRVAGARRGARRNFAGPGDTVELRPAYVWEE